MSNPSVPKLLAKVLIKVNCIDQWFPSFFGRAPPLAYLHPYKHSYISFAWKLLLHLNAVINAELQLKGSSGVWQTFPSLVVCSKCLSWLRHFGDLVHWVCEARHWGVRKWFLFNLWASSFPLFPPRRFWSHLAVRKPLTKPSHVTKQPRGRIPISSRSAEKLGVSDSVSDTPPSAGDAVLPFQMSLFQASLSEAPFGTSQIPPQVTATTESDGCYYWTVLVTVQLLHPSAEQSARLWSHH